MENSSTQGRVLHDKQVILDAINTISATVFALRCVIAQTQTDAELKNKCNRLLQVAVHLGTQLANHIDMPDARPRTSPDMNDPLLARLTDIMAMLGDRNTHENAVHIMDPDFRRVLFLYCFKAGAYSPTGDINAFNDWYEKTFTK